MNKLTANDLTELLVNKSQEELVQYLKETYKNMQIQVTDSVLLITYDSPLILANDVQMNKTTNQWDSFADTIRRCKVNRIIESTEQPDDLIDQLFTSQTSYSLAFDMESKQLLHKCPLVAKCLNPTQNVYYKTNKLDELKGVSQVNNIIKMTAVPYGLQFQALFIKDKWVFCSPNRFNLNTATFNTKTTVETEFIRLLTESGLSMDSMQKDTVYTFIMGLNAFSAFPLKTDYLIVKHIYRANANKQTEVDTIPSDPLEILRHPCTKSFVVNTKSKSHQTVKYLLNKKRQQLVQQGVQTHIPISHFIVNKDNANYQYNTPLFDAMWQFYVYIFTNQTLCLAQSTEQLNQPFQDRFNVFIQNNTMKDPFSSY